MSDNNNIRISDPYEIFTSCSKGVCTYNIYIGDNISGPENYAGLCNELRMASPDTEVNFYIAGNGGSVAGLLALISAIEGCSATVHGVITSNVHSAHTTLALACDILSSHQNAYLMFHDYSSDMYGKSGEIESQHKANKKLIHGYMSDIHIPFLTKEENQTIVKGEDLYFLVSDKETQKRLRRHNKHKIALNKSNDND